MRLSRQGLYINNSNLIVASFKEKFALYIDISEVLHPISFTSETSLFKSSLVICKQSNEGSLWYYVSACANCTFWNQERGRRYYRTKLGICSQETYLWKVVVILVQDNSKIQQRNYNTMQIIIAQRSYVEFHGSTSPSTGFLLCHQEGSDRPLRQFFQARLFMPGYVWDSGDCARGMALLDLRQCYSVSDSATESQRNFLIRLVTRNKSSIASASSYSLS